jgi:hypothetical protein
LSNSNILGLLTCQTHIYMINSNIEFGRKRNSYHLGSTFYLTFFFFRFEETSPSWKAHFGAQVREQNPGCPKLLQEVHALTRTRDLLCRSQTLYHHATPLEDILLNLCMLDYHLAFNSFKHEVYIYIYIFSLPSNNSVTLYTCQHF